MMSVKQLRAITGLSQKAFGEKYHIPKRTVENWESGSRKPSETVLYLLEKAVKGDYEMKEYRIVAVRTYGGSIDEFDIGTCYDAESAIERSKEEWECLSEHGRKYQTIEIRFDEDEDGYNTIEWKE